MRRRALRSGRAICRGPTQPLLGLRRTAYDRAGNLRLEMVDDEIKDKYDEEQKRIRRKSRKGSYVPSFLKSSSSRALDREESADLV